MGWVGQRQRATGDLIDADVWNYLHVDSQIFSEYQIQSGAFVTKSGAQLCAANDLVTFDTEVLDTDDYHESVTNPERLTSAVSGPVILSYYVPTDIAASFTLMVNGNVFVGAFEGTSTIFCKTIYLAPAAGTYMTLRCNTNGATVAAGAWAAIKQEAIGNV